MEKRLQKFISEEGVMSRRAAEEEIKRGPREKIHRCERGKQYRPWGGMAEGLGTK